MKTCPKISHQVIILTLFIFLTSCSTSRVISFSDVSKGRNPEEIRLNNGVEYRIYSYLVDNRISGDTLILFNRKDNTILAEIPESKINSLVTTEGMRKDSPYRYLYLLPLLLVSFNF